MIICSVIWYIWELVMIVLLRMLIIYLFASHVMKLLNEFNLVEQSEGDDRQGGEAHVKPEQTTIRKKI